jgi:hypothetical protein
VLANAQAEEADPFNRAKKILRPILEDFALRSVDAGQRGLGCLERVIQLRQNPADWVSFNDAVDLICARLGVPPDRAIAELQQARNSGEVSYWPKSPPTLLDHKMTPQRVDDTFGASRSGISA